MRKPTSDNEIPQNLILVYSRILRNKYKEQIFTPQFQFQFALPIPFSQNKCDFHIGTMVKKNMKPITKKNRMGGVNQLQTGHSAMLSLWLQKDRILTYADKNAE